MPFPPEWGGGWTGQAPVARPCGENAQTHGSWGVWGGPSATNATGLTDCRSGSCSNGRDEWDPLSARPAGRERPPRKLPWLAQPAFRRGRSRDHSLQEGRAAPKGREGVRHNRSDCRVNALRVRGRSQRPMHSRQGFRLRRFHQTPLAGHKLRPAPSDSCPIQPNTS